MATFTYSTLISSRSLERALDVATETGELILHGRKLREWPVSTHKCDLSDTVLADLSRNALTEVPRHLCSFFSLERLNLYHNAIKFIPEQIHQIHMLKILDLSRNQLTFIPPALCKLPNLEILILNNNKLLSLPEEIGQLERLIELDVHTNEITQLPSQLGTLSSLRTLNVRHNLLLELPSEICQLKLIHLDCSSNRLTQLPVDLREMTSLVELNVEQNPLGSPPSSICALGLLHIMRYLLVEAMKDEKQRGVLTEHEINAKYRNSFSYQGSRQVPCGKHPRRTVVPSDSGYLTTEGSDKTTGEDDASLPGQSILMLTLADQFSKELARQKSDYEKRKCQAQQLKRHLLQQLGETEHQRAKTREMARRSHEEKLAKMEKQREDARRKMENRTVQLFHSPSSKEEEEEEEKSSSFRRSINPYERNESLHQTVPVARPSHLGRRSKSFGTNDDSLQLDQMKKIIEHRLKVTLPDDLGYALSDGVVLCHFINQIQARAVPSIHVPSQAVPKLSLAKCRRNVENFLDACHRLGVPEPCLAKLTDLIIMPANQMPQLAAHRLLLTLTYLDYLSLHSSSTSTSISMIDRWIANLLLVFLAMTSVFTVYYHLYF